MSREYKHDEIGVIAIGILSIVFLVSLILILTNTTSRTKWLPVYIPGLVIPVLLVGGLYLTRRIRKGDRMKRTKWEKEFKKLEQFKEKSPVSSDFNLLGELLGLSSLKGFIKTDNSIEAELPENHNFSLFKRIQITYDDAFKALAVRLQFRTDSYLVLDINRKFTRLSPFKNAFTIPMISNVYNLSSTTPEIWQNLLSHPLAKQNLLLMRPHLEYVSIKGEFIEALLYTERAVINFLQWLKDINPTLERNDISPKLSQEVEIMECYNCGDAFDPMEEKCEKCNSPRPRCIVCFQDLKPARDLDVVTHPCCGIYSHKDHIVSWLRSKSKCPNCKSDLTTWFNQLRSRKRFDVGGKI